MIVLRALLGIYFWMMALCLTIFFFTACVVTQAWIVLSRQPRDGRAIHQIAAAWGRWLIRLTPGWHVDIEGRENLLPDRQACVMVANHESMSDIFAMYYLGVQFRWLSKAVIFKVPLVGSAMRWAEYVPIVRGAKDSHLQAMQASEACLRKDVPMFFFPEGTRSHDGQIKPFKLGAFRLAHDLQVPISPIAIHGAADLLPKGSWMPGIARVSLKVLPALPPPPLDKKAGEDGLTLDQYAEKVRQQIIQAHKNIGA